MVWLRAQLRQGILGQDRRGMVLCAILAVVLFVANQFYDRLNHGPYVLVLNNPLDERIPLVPAFIIPYLSLDLLAYLSLIAFFLFRARLFQAAALSMLVVTLISFGFYYFLQSYVPRPVLVGDDWLTALVRQTYALDNPYNAFPSLHTAWATGLTIFWWRVSPRIGGPFAIWAALIMLSTLFVKQHYVPDLLAGLGLAAGVSAFFLWWILDRPRAPAAPPLISTPRRQAAKTQR